MEKIGEYFHLAWRNLRNRRLRSWLTILGIVIGVFLIISLISLSEGLKESMMKQLRMLGGDLIFVMPGGEMSDVIMTLLGGTELSDADVRTIEKTRGVEQVVVFPYAAGIARHEGTSKISFLAGVSWDKATSILKEDMGYKTTEGNFPRSGKKEVLIGILAFASIALIVGGIGIMNTMYTSVRERTREIGIMKAVGAKNSAVLSIFLIEAGIIGIIGGLGGTLLGIIFAKTIEIYGQYHPVFYITASVTPGLIIFGLIFSLLVGCLSGFFPARRAAQLKPVEALRRFE